MTRGAIVFDLDGTLIDSARDINAVANATLRSIGASGISLAQTHSFIGNGSGEFVSKMMRAGDLGDNPELHARLHAKFEEFYMTATSLSVLYPNVVDTLQTLVAAGFRLGLCTNKPFAATQVVLQYFDLAKFFAATAGGDSQPTRKPDAAPLLAVFESLGGAATHRFYVGDSEVDAETATNAAVPFALFTEGYRKTPVAELVSAYTFGDFAELPDICARHFG